MNEKIKRLEEILYYSKDSMFSRIRSLKLDLLPEHEKEILEFAKYTRQKIDNKEDATVEVLQIMELIVALIRYNFLEWSLSLAEKIYIIIYPLKNKI